MNLLGNPLELVSHAADAVEVVTDLLAPDDEQQDRRRAGPGSRAALLVGAIVLAGLVFFVMSYLTSDPLGSVPAAAPVGMHDDRTLATPHAAYFQDCAAARAARAVPLISSQRAYRPGLDDDRDGIACEEGETGLS